jgi:hypothetical protein
MRREEEEAITQDTQEYLKPVKQEVLSNTVLRKYLRKIEDSFIGRTEDKKLDSLNPYLEHVEELIATHERPLRESIEQWRTNLERQETTKNRQFNKKEVRALFSSSTLCLDIYKAFIDGIVSCPEKHEVLNLAYWPIDGDSNIRLILLDNSLIGYAAMVADETVNTLAVQGSIDYDSEFNSDQQLDISHEQVRANFFAAFPTLHSIVHDYEEGSTWGLEGLY